MLGSTHSLKQSFGDIFGSTPLLLTRLKIYFLPLHRVSAFNLVLQLHFLCIFLSVAVSCKIIRRSVVNVFRLDVLNYVRHVFNFCYNFYSECIGRKVWDVLNRSVYGVDRLLMCCSINAGLKLNYAMPVLP
jgi:hypothetical protein